MYFEQAGISQSMLKLLRKPNTPADYYYRYLSGEYEDKNTKSLEFGTKLDMALFEPENFSIAYSVLYGQKTTTKLGCIAEGEYNDIMKMVEKINSAKLSHDNDVTLGQVLKRAATQATLSWTCPRTGLQRKGKPDITLPNGDVMDLKSCEDASPEGFAKAAYNYGYHIQAADYLEGNRVQNDKIGDFYIIAVEKVAPYKVVVYKLSHEFIALGYEERDKLIDLYLECSKNNYWPGYSDEIMELSLPSWLSKKQF